MSVDLSKLVQRRKIEIDELSRKTVAIDAYNVLYQFISIIRQPDGTPLMDTHGNVTSHLSGLFYRTLDLIDHGVKPVYVFDGIPSMLKQKTIQARMQRRNAATAAWQEAKDRGDVEAAGRHAQASTRITKEMVESSKRLLELICVPYVNAPSEGEAQATQMCKDGLAYAVGSQDYDTMLLGAPHVVRNLTISGKRKLPGKNIYITVEPEILSFEDTLKSLEISQKQLIWIGILLGTDFNDGVKGVGPKNALKIAKGAKSIEDIERVVKEKYDQSFELDIREVEALFLNPEVKRVEERELKEFSSSSPSKDAIIRFMCDEHDFSTDRVGKLADRLIEHTAGAKQRGIGSWME